MNRLLAALALTHALDITSSQVAFSRGAREANPFAPRSLPLSIAAHAGAVGLAALSYAELKQTHPRAAKWLLVGLVVGEGAAVAWNVRVASRLR